MPHITMAQIAARAGVCKATVSLALRNDTRISRETITHVQKVAKDLGYTRHPVIDDLMSELRRSRGFGYQRTIALVNAHPQRRAFAEHVNISSWVEGCRQRATYLGYAIDEFWLHDPELDGARLSRILQTRGIRGMVVIGAFGADRFPERFDSMWAGFACVVTGIRTHNPAFSFTCVDHHNLVLDAVQQVRALGYRRPGLVTAHRVDQVTDGRFTCAMWLAQQALAPVDRLPPLISAGRGESLDQQFWPWYHKHRPDVILTLHTNVREMLADQKIRVPRDVGLVHLERNRHSADWAGMEQHNNIAGEAAVDMLAGMMQSNEVGVPVFPRATLIGATWVPGRTACPQTRVSRSSRSNSF